jgi:hypothetical protein
MELKDDEMRTVVESLDKMLDTTCAEYNIPPLTMCGILLARMVHLCRLLSMEEDLAKLMISISESIVNKELEQPDLKNLH